MLCPKFDEPSHKMGSIELDKTVFYRRIKQLYSTWKDGNNIKHDDSLSKVDCIVTTVSFVMFSQVAHVKRDTNIFLGWQR